MRVLPFSEQRLRVRTELFGMLRNAYSARMDCEVVSEDAKQCVVRKRVLNEDENQTQVMLEMEVQGIRPGQFARLFETIEDTQTQWNEHCKKCELIIREED